MEEYKFERYRLFYLSGQTEYRAKITCYEDAERVAMIFFIDEEKELPENMLSVIPMRIYYSIKDFLNILTVIENEYPLSIFLHDNGKTCEIAKRGYI